MAAISATSGRLFVVVGPTGVGKDTLLQKLRTDLPNRFVKAISTTTRATRPQEVNGVDYHFVTPDEFRAKIDNKEFLEYATVHGNYYGTTVCSVDKVLQEGKDVIKDLDVQGCVIIKSVASMKDRTTAIFIIPPGESLAEQLTVLEGRVRGRNSGESEEAIKVRLDTARDELSVLSDDRRVHFDHVVVNGDIDEAYAALRKAIVGEVTI